MNKRFEDVIRAAFEAGARHTDSERNGETFDHPAATWDQWIDQGVTLWRQEQLP